MPALLSKRSAARRCAFHPRRDDEARAGFELRGQRPATSRFLYPQHSDLRFLYRRVEGGLQGKTEYGAGIAGVDDAIVPEAGSAEIGLGLVFVSLSDLSLSFSLLARG